MANSQSRPSIWKNDSHSTSDDLRPKLKKCLPSHDGCWFPKSNISPPIGGGAVKAGGASPTVGTREALAGLSFGLSLYIMSCIVGSFRTLASSAKRHPWPISNRQDSKRWSRRAHRVLHLQLAKLGFLILPVVSLAKVPQLSSVGDGFDDTYSTQLRPIQKSPDKLYTFVRQRSPVIKFDRRLIGDRFLFL
ncbi:hypothetical protein PGT21_036171 [Puccinia graminis f. sp. tritici]|uniref:Uncharacterized protein n=1 Tax=Puccinia graminis f. sp. tritici TaxID=56615 RepID=A0A5B0R3E5_PUCGR|nr:hypothetical protein PGT21_036171 [Puccinia graminis f. sp. tritici]